jgi:hypothetical protein
MVQRLQLEGLCDLANPALIRGKSRNYPGHRSAQNILSIHLEFIALCYKALC